MKTLILILMCYSAFLGCASVQIEKDFVTKNDEIVFSVKTKNAYRVICGLPTDLYKKVGSGYELMEKYVPSENHGPYQLDGKSYPEAEIFSEGCDVLECVKMDDVEYIGIPLTIYKILSKEPIESYETSSLSGQFRIDLWYYDEPQCNSPKKASLEFVR